MCNVCLYNTILLEILQEIRQLLEANAGYSVEFVGSQNNRMTHLMAKKALDLFTTGVLGLTSGHGWARKSV
ncbi:unnamed protein product [Linum trigynum]|uniref:Uncharacterized protein n=1 Tax=Linum trigynum TaxID=586398 RepID=A0AAV2CNM8_9ROSI